jgi:NAD-dependent dihydropyrimidine dehydrogenase PreA subunit
VLDYDRCVNCKQCMSFCPFGVYALSEERKVEVRTPRSCKDGCPACARMCPELAIVFPKVKETPIDGAEVSGEHVAARRAAKIDEQLKKGGSLHELLAKRRKAAAMAAAARGATAGQNSTGGAGSGQR